MSNSDLMNQPELARRAAGSDETPAVSMRNVMKRFGVGVIAVNDANFDVGKSEFFSLLGPSGCGKTTTLRMIAGFESPTQGRIIIDGVNAATLPVHRRNTNMVFQNYALFPHLTVAQNVAFGPERRKLSRKEVRQRVADVLDAVHLAEYGSRYPRELSGGQQQRVALARALANRPAVLLLDEPLGALDLKLRENMQFELKRIQREVGISFVYVTHDQGEAITMSDRIAVMNMGRIEHLGTPEEIYLRPRTLFVASFIGQANLLPCKIETQQKFHMELRLDEGSVLVASSGAQECAPDSQATVMIRPEHLKLRTAEPEQAAGSFPVRLVDETFQGSLARYTAEMSTGTKVVILVPADERPDRRSFTDQVWVTCKAERAYVLAERASTEALFSEE